MPTLTTSSSVSQIAARFQGRGTSSTNTLTTPDPNRDANWDSWNNLISSRLVAWELSTDSLDDGDSIPPTQLAIAIALRHARSWRDVTLPCPIDMIPDGDGGIFFQFPEAAQFAINIVSDGSIDRLYFRGDRLIKREHFPIG